MNDSPGWATPGPPSDENRRGDAPAATPDEASADPNRPAGPAEPGEDAQPTQSPTERTQDPAKPTEDARPAGAAQDPAQPGQAAQAAQPTPAAQPAESAQAARPAQPGQGTQAAQAAAPAQGAQPTESGEPAQSPQPAQPGQAAQPTQDARPAQPGQGTQAAQPTPTAQPADAAQSAQAAGPAEGGQAAQPAAPAQGAQPTQSGEPAEPGQAAQAAQPSEPGQGTQAVQPAEGAQRARAASQWAQPGEPGQGTQPGAGAQAAGGGPKWSAEQPPPGQWSNPGTTPQAPAPASTPTPAQAPAQGGGWGRQTGGAPYAGQYGYPGGPGHWGHLPPAAKPGVIPLRPLGLGEILDGSVATMRTHWRSVIPITLVVATVLQVITVLMQKFLLDDVVFTPTENMTPEEALNSLGDTVGSTLVVSGITQFLQALGTLVVTAMLTMIFSRAVLGRHSSVSEAWRDARPQLLRLIGLTLLMALGALVLGAVLIAPGALAGSVGLVILGVFLWLPLIIWLGIKFALASPALMLEKSPVIKAFARSSKLVQGAWWRIFGITLLTSLIAFFVAMVIVTPFQLLGHFAFGGGFDTLADPGAQTAWGSLIFSGIGLIIAQTIIMPIQSGVTVLLYVDQRIRREGLDLELARAAGIENYGTTGG